MRNLFKFGLISSLTLLIACQPDIDKPDLGPSVSYNCALGMDLTINIQQDVTSDFDKTNAGYTTTVTSSTCNSGSGVGQSANGTYDRVQRIANALKITDSGTTDNLTITGTNINIPPETQGCLNGLYLQLIVNSATLDAASQSIKMDITTNVDENYCQSFFVGLKAEKAEKEAGLNLLNLVKDYL